MQQMYHPSDLAPRDPLVLMKNLDHVRMTSRRLRYILQQQMHLYTPEANQVREQIDRYVEAERQIESEMSRRQRRAGREHAARASGLGRPLGSLPRPILSDHFGNEGCQGRHLEEREPDAVGSEVVGTPAAEESPPR